MQDAPKKLDGATVLRWSMIDDRHNWTDPCRHFVAGQLQGKFRGLAVCRYDGAEEVYLFYCDAEWNVVTDGFYSKLEDAVSEAESKYEGVAETWVISE